jgi:DNA-binding transcriptional regulator/RsmH inhibitor MraZ
MVVSADMRLEIWDAEAYLAFMQEIQRKNERLMKRMGAIGLFS